MSLTLYCNKFGSRTDWLIFLPDVLVSFNPSETEDCPDSRCRRSYRVEEVNTIFPFVAADRWADIEGLWRYTSLLWLGW